MGQRQIPLELRCRKYVAEDGIGEAAAGFNIGGIMYAADEAAVCIVVSAGENGVVPFGEHLGEREGFKIACKSVSAGV